MKNSNDTIANRTRDLPVCSAVVFQHILHHIFVSDRLQVNLKRYSFGILTDPVIRLRLVCNGISSPIFRMQHNRHSQYSTYLGRQSNRVQARSITAWADFLGELVMERCLRSAQSCCASFPFLMRVGWRRTELHGMFSWQDMKEGDLFAGVHVVEGIILKLRQR